MDDKALFSFKRKSENKAIAYFHFDIRLNLKLRWLRENTEDTGEGEGPEQAAESRGEEERGEFRQAELVGAVKGDGAGLCASDFCGTLHLLLGHVVSCLVHYSIRGRCKKVVRNGKMI